MIPDLFSNREARDWVNRAACRGTDVEVFFMENGETARAKRICARCDVQAECLAYALANGEKHGVWGGYTTSARKDIARGRAVREKVCVECGDVFLLRPGQWGATVLCSEECRRTRRARLQYESNLRNRVA